MPHSKIKSVSVSQVWDDETEDVYKITIYDDDDDDDFKGIGVSLRNGDNTINIYPHSWDDIKDQMDSFFDKLGTE